MSTVAIPDLNSKILTRKSELPQGNLPCSLTQNKITRKTNLKLTYIEHHLIKDEVANMEYVEYNSTFRWNVMNADVIEGFSNL